MIFKLNITLNEAYYNEAYQAIISTLRFKKFEPYLAVALFVAGIILFFRDHYKVLGFFPILFCLLGIYEFIKPVLEKRKWLKARMNNKLLNEKIEIEINSDGFVSNGPFSAGTIKWSGFHKIVKTQNGILLKPENGTSIYLPDQSFENNAQIDFILSHK